MTVTDALHNAGVQINHKNMPVRNPTKDAFARVIDTLRKAEKQVTDERDGARVEANHSAQLLLDAQAEIQKLKAQVLKLELENRLRETSYDALTTADKRRLLDVASTPETADVV